MKVIITGESDMNDNPPSIREIGEALEELKGIGLCKNIKDTSAQSASGLLPWVKIVKQ